MNDPAPQLEQPPPGTQSDQPKFKSDYAQDPGVPSFRLLGIEPILAQRIIRLGVPVIIGMLTQTAINIIDGLMVGRLPDEVAVIGTAAIGPSLILLWAFGGFLSAISVGTQAMTARRIGEGTPKKAGQVLANSLTVAVLASVTVTLFAVWAARPIFEFISNDNAVQEAGTVYSRIRFIGILSMVTMASFKSFYDGLGQVRVHMTVAICMNIINATLNYFLIFGFDFGAFEVPALEVNGAGIASVISSYMGVLGIMLWSLRKKDRVRYRVYNAANLNRKVAYSVSILSLWSGLATSVVMVGFGLFYAIVGKIDALEGLQAVNTSATSVIINIMMLVFMTALAFGTSTATLVSQSLGNNQPGLAERYGWQSMILMTLVMSLFGSTFYFYPEHWLQMFLPAQMEGQDVLKLQVIQVAIPALKLCALLAPIAAAGLVFTQALYGAGQTRFVMAVELFLHFTCLVPLAYWFAVSLEWGFMGCWWATLVYVTSLAIATGARFASGKWKTEVI